MSHKVVKLAYWLVPILFLSLCPLALVAQYGNAQEKQEKQPEKAAHKQTVTGCLQKGDEADEFSITGEDGKTWGLRSSTVKLDQHLGQVTSCRLGHANSGFATAPLPKLLGDRAWGRDCLYDRCCNNIALTLISIVLKLQNLFRLQRFSGSMRRPRLVGL